MKPMFTIAELHDKSGTFMRCIGLYTDHELVQEDVNRLNNKSENCFCVVEIQEMGEES